MSRRRMFIKTLSHNLPSEYQEIAYLESTGVQYINTNIIPHTTYTTIVENLFTQNTISSDSSIFGSSDGGNTRYWINYSNKFEIGYNPYYSTVITTNNTVINKIIFNEISSSYHIHYINNMQFYTIGNITTTTPIIIFGRNVNGTKYLSSQRIYTFLIRNFENMILNLIPCYRRSDSKPGMYDLVSNTFFVNQGTGEFICGPAVY